jgi:hypothetical protein
MGQVVSFVHYMPCKPIKHGLEVAVCCTFTAVLLGFEIYCDADSNNNQDNSALGVIQQLLQKSYLTDARGRNLYTDYWYTMVDLAKWLKGTLGFFFCSTQTPTKSSKAGHGCTISFAFIRCIASHRAWMVL